MRNYSISETAKEVGVQRATLYEWIRGKKIPTPKTQMISGVRFCFWTEKDLKKIKEHKAKHYRDKPSLRKKNRAKHN